MYTILECPACESVPNRTSPFLADYAVGASVAPSRLVECSSCGLRLFDARLTDDEVNRLYAGYRGNRFYSCCQHHKFWHTKAVNQRIGRDPLEISARTRASERFLHRHLAPEAIGRVPDDGGDRGQFIPSSVGREKFVFEISDAVPVEGVRQVSAESELPGYCFDLVMLCHVLEHSSDPGSLVWRLKRALAGNATWFYIKVRFERASLAWAGRSRWQERYLAWMVGRRWAWTIADFYSTVCRFRWNVVPPLGVLKCHEHPSFFAEQSLWVLLDRSGFQVAGCQVGEIRSRSGVTSVMQALAR